MSEEYITLQNMVEQLKNESNYWRKLSNSKEHHSINLSAEIEILHRNLVIANAENEEFSRVNAKIWDQTKLWIKEDSEIISKQAAQIRFLVEKVKKLENK
jgi:hypothetical protein